MIVHTMTHAQMVAEARKDFPSLRNKLVEPVRTLRREHLRDRKSALLHMFPWKSQNRNNWLIVIKYSKASVSTYTLAWFHDRQGRIAAVWTTAGGMAYYIDPHVIERYGERFDPTANPLERLQSFFFENYWYALQVEEQRGEEHWNVSIGLNQGLGLGEWDTTTDIVHFRTFVNHGQLFPGQQEKMERMDYERIWSGLTEGQRIDLVNKARILAAEEEQSKAA